MVDGKGTKPKFFSPLSSNEFLSLVVCGRRILIFPQLLKTLVVVKRRRWWSSFFINLVLLLWLWPWHGMRGHKWMMRRENSSQQR